MPVCIWRGGSLVSLRGSQDYPRIHLWGEVGTYVHRMYREVPLTNRDKCGALIGCDRNAELWLAVTRHVISGHAHIITCVSVRDLWHDLLDSQILGGLKPQNSSEISGLGLFYIKISWALIGQNFFIFFFLKICFFPRGLGIFPEISPIRYLGRTFCSNSKVLFISIFVPH